MKREFQYPSRDGVTQIHAIEWEPEFTWSDMTIWDMENLCKMKNIMDIFIKRMEMNM